MIESIFRDRERERRETKKENKDKSIQYPNMQKHFNVIKSIRTYARTELKEKKEQNENRISFRLRGYLLIIRQG